MSENFEENLNIEVETSEWVLEMATKWLEEYKNCKTENCKSKIKIKLQALAPRLEYEKEKLSKIIKEAKDQGFEF